MEENTMKQLKKLHWQYKNNGNTEMVEKCYRQMRIILITQ